MRSEIWSPTNPNHLKSGQVAAILSKTVWTKMSRFRMVRDHLKSNLQNVLISNGRISNPHCIQYASDYQTSLVLKWLKPVRLVNGLVFDFDLNTGSMVQFLGVCSKSGQK